MTLIACSGYYPLFQQNSCPRWEHCICPWGGSAHWTKSSTAVLLTKDKVKRYKYLHAGLLSCLHGTSHNWTINGSVWIPEPIWVRAMQPTIFSFYSYPVSTLNPR